MMDLGSREMYHIGLRPEQGAAYALLTGDPGRVEAVAARLEDPAFVCANREYTTWAGRLEGERVLVTSHGIGGPSTAICVEELARCGVRTMIRVGTCGGMRLDVLGGDLVVATAAIRQEGTSREYLPVEFPAAADFRVTAALAWFTARIPFMDSTARKVLHRPPGCWSSGKPGSGAAVWHPRWSRRRCSSWRLPGKSGQAACCRFSGTRSGRPLGWTIPGRMARALPSTRRRRR